MILIKKLVIVISITFITIQIVQPARNKSDQILATDISKIVSISDSVQSLIKNACYDCHSNTTTYPWYSNIQPMGWLMAKHIKQGKEELNFSEYGNYSLRRQISKLDGIVNSIKDDIMPLWSYKLMHQNAQLSTIEKMQIIEWAQRAKENLSTK